MGAPVPVKKLQALKRRNDFELDEVEVWLMANVGPRTTGLPMVVYVSPKYAPHGPRIKFSQHYGEKLRMGEWFYMTVEDEPRFMGNSGDIKVRDLARVAEFIRINKGALLKYWEQEEPVCTADVLQEIKPLK